MKISTKVLLILFIGILLVFTAYAVLLGGQTATPSSSDASEITPPADSIPPVISFVTGEAMGDAGSSVIITASFSDNVAVTSAKLYYKPATAVAWSSKSILDGTATFLLPEESNESWQYYITVNDAAGNGPIGDPSTDGSLFYIIEAMYIPSPLNNTTPDDEPNENQNTTRFVFIELATKLVCSNCPKVSKIIDKLYSTNTLPFYYVTLPINNPKAMERLTELNQYATPTTYIDGGFMVMYGSSFTPSDFERNISGTTERITPKISIRTTAQWDNQSNSIIVHVHLINTDAISYVGHLRVYETEIIQTTWQASIPEHFSFLDFLINQDITIPSNNDLYINKTTSVTGIDPDNIMLFSVLFNGQKTTGYSQPPDKNPFDVHLVDSVTATRVIQGGNLPPEVSITSPTIKMVHHFGKPFRASLLGKTILLGKIIVVASAHDDSKVTKVEFYINNKLMATTTSEPYQWTWQSFTFGKRTLMVKAYDNMGKNVTTSMIVFAGMF